MWDSTRGCNMEGLKQIKDNEFNYKGIDITFDTNAETSVNEEDKCGVSTFVIFFDKGELEDYVEVDVEFGINWFDYEETSRITGNVYGSMWQEDSSCICGGSCSTRDYSLVEKEYNQVNINDIQKEFGLNKGELESLIDSIMTTLRETKLDDWLDDELTEYYN